MERFNHISVDMPWLPKVKSKKVGLKRVVKLILTILSVVLVFGASYLPLTYKWSRDTWSDLTIEEIVYHLTMPAEGTASNMISGHIIRCLLPALLITAAFIVALVVIRKRMTASAFTKGVAAALSGIIIANTFAVFWKNMDISQYMENQSTYSSFIDDNYVDPSSVDITFPEKKRNLIYIFMESTENTFADTSVGGAFETNVIPELTQLSLENENFSGGNTQLNGGVPMKGATWTMGAMFAQTSGLPLMTSLGQNEMSSQEEFFPGATTLGDVLEDEGYNQTLLLGSDATFGGRKLYFTTHGNYSIKDYLYYTSNGTLPSNYYVWWGYEDLHLYENAKNELNELSSKSEPFNLTMLTVDTHFENGYVCSLCQNDYDDQYSNVYRCASRQVTEFINWCKEQSWYDNTTIVIAGDHLTMDADYCNNVPDDYQRTVYTTIINGAASVEEETYRNYTTFDMYPTTLAALGATIPGDKLALGTNLYSSTPTLLEEYGYEGLEEGISAKSELMDNLTAGIVEKKGKIEANGYSVDTNTLQVIVSDVDVDGIGTDSEVIVRVIKNSENAGYNFTGEDRGDGSYIFNIPLDKFKYKSGNYIVSAMVKDIGATDLSAFTIASTSVDISDPNESSAASDGSDSSLGLTIGDYDYAAGTFDISYLKANTSNIASVRFAVWKAADQSDLRWYNAERGEDGSYRTSINAFDFAFDDTSYNIHVYEDMIDGTSKLAATATHKIAEDEQ